MSQPKHNIGKALLLGMQFFCLFSTFSSAQNMIAQLFEQNGGTNLGVVSLIVLYLVLGFASFFAPNVCYQFQAKWVILFSSFGFVAFISNGILIASCHNENSGICNSTVITTFIIIGAILCGLGAACIWISQAWYISKMSTSSTRGLYFGVFFVLLQSSQIVANILSAILLKYSVLTYFSTLTLIAAGSSVFSILLPNVENQIEDFKGLKYRLSTFCRIISDKSLKPLLFYFILEGAIVAFYTGFLYKLVRASLPDLEEGELYIQTAYVFIVLGLFQVIGASLIGYLADKQNRFLLSSISTILVELAVVASIAALQLKQYNLCFVASALWGISDSIVQNLCAVLTSTLFPEQIEAFAAMRLVQGFSITTFLLLSLYIDSLTFILVIGLIEIIANITSSKIGVIREKI